MGIKMQKVRHHGKELKIIEYDVNREYGQLKCFYCDADVSFVNSYERNLGERKITVHRFFRLKGGQEHRNGCKYTVDGAVLDIYAACADDELMSKQDNKFVVRLLLASDDIEGKSRIISMMYQAMEKENIIIFQKVKKRHIYQLYIK